MRRLYFPVVAMATMATLVGGCQSAQPGRLPRHEPYLQVPAGEAAPAVSGDAHDPAWAQAAIISELGLALHSPPTDRALPTQVRLLWDANWLYIRVISTGPRPYAPYGRQRDALHYQGDAVEVFLDPVGDGRQYFELQQSPAGGLFDQNTLLTSDAESDAEGRLLPEVLKRNYWPNRSYDMPGVRNAGTVSASGKQFVWIADFALPAEAVLKRTGKTHFEPMRLRVNVIRYHWTGPLADSRRRLIAMNWSAVVWGCPHQSPAAMGTIELVAAGEQHR